MHRGAMYRPLRLCSGFHSAMEHRVSPLNTPTPSRLQRLWLSETIRLREEHAGPLDDSEANRRAQAKGGALAERIQNRAWLLAERDGQVKALQHWLQGARLAGLLLVLLAVIGGSALAVAALGDGQRPVNVFWALGSLLGLHLLLLLGWGLSLLLSRDGAGALGHLWLWLSEKLARDAQAAQLAPALFGAVPLMLATGSGAELRQPLGWVMVGGLLVSQVLTLFTTPVIYLYFDRLSRRVSGRSAAGLAV